ncbi:hypothetical protein [Deinococcus ficus]|uniref:Uncharacterized protein n=1 Tax=Deinococcus ficus TaxID=317577 RepID=A0A221T337_9DEIO|nr:hypothetical protein [Deinococcus ficus]ASN83337.1 hypothetical protein DFI_19255 [Deinococcus ficus]
MTPDLSVPFRRRAEFGSAGSLYVGLQPPTQSLRSPLVARDQAAPAQPRHTTRPHMLAVGDHDLDLHGALLTPQVLYALARGEQVLAFGHASAQLSARLALAGVTGHRAAVACLTRHAAVHAAPLLADHPDLSLLLIGSAADQPGLDLFAHRILRSWDEADLIEVLSPSPSASRQTAGVNAHILERWLASRTTRRGVHVRPALVHVDLPGSRLIPARDVLDASERERAQVVLHVPLWSHLEDTVGAPGIQRLTAQVGSVVSARHTPWRQSPGLNSRSSDPAGTPAGPYALLVTVDGGEETVHLPPPELPSFPADAQHAAWLTTPELFQLMKQQDGLR